MARYSRPPAASIVEVTSPVAWDTPVGLSFGALEFSRSMKHWINDGLMTLFFFVVAIELKREIVLGELRNPTIAPAAR